MALEVDLSIWCDRLAKTDKTGWNWVKLQAIGYRQGSSFGPLLWNMFQNDLPLHVENANITTYADDHQLHVKGTNHEIVRQQLKTSSKQALTWYSNNFLSANPEYKPPKNWWRYEWCSAKPGWPSHWQIRGHWTTRSPHRRRPWFQEAYISELCNKTSQKVGILSRLRHLIPSKAKLLLYEAFILPHLTYCHLIWHFCKSSYKRKVERIHAQERALSRAIYRSHSDTYEELLERANLPTLYNRLQDIVVLMYKVK